MAIQMIPSIQSTADIPGLASLANVAGWTIMGWIRPFSFATANVLWDISVGSGLTNTRASIVIETTGALSVQARSTDAEGIKALTTAVGQVAAGELFHFAGAASYANGTLQVFKNGVQLATSGVTFAAGVSSNTVSTAAFVGSDAGHASGFVNGVVEDCRIYNRVLGIGEIKTIVAARGADGIRQGMTNQYYFNEFPVNFSVAGPGVYVDLGSARRNATANGAIYVPGTINFRSRPRIATGRVW